MANKSESDSSWESEEENDTREKDKDLESIIEKLNKLKSRLPTSINTTTIVEYHAKDIIQKLISDLYKSYDTTFLSDYYKVLESDDAAAIKQVSNDILSSIQQSLRSRGGRSFSEWEAVTLAAWLSAAALWAAPRLPAAAPTFRALLAVLKEDEMRRIAAMWERSVPAGALLELADISRAPPASPVLADALLRAALHALAPPEQAGAGVLRAAEVAAAADAAGRECPRRLLLRVGARVLAAERSDALIASLARAVKDGSYEGRSEREQVNTSVSKFQTLFGKGELIPMRTGKRKSRDSPAVRKNARGRR